MSDMVSLAVPRSIDTIRRVAQTVKHALGYDDLAYINAEHLLEFALPSILPSFIYDVKSVAEMGNNEGLASPDRDYIAIREDVYQGARRQWGRDRFTVAHEVGHLVLHQSENLVLRRSLRPDRPPAIFCQPEWQADTFAAELMMDFRLINQDDDERDIANRFGVSLSAARTRIKTLNRTWNSETKSEPNRRPGSRNKS